MAAPAASAAWSDLAFADARSLAKVVVIARLGPDRLALLVD